MNLGLTATVKAFAAISIAATLNKAQGQVSPLIDETQIATCVINNINDLKSMHAWDLEFEGYTSLEKMTMPSNG